ncbi:histidine kinase [Robiginitalea sp. IMCC44478]|uniref:histidine kinase n=1 Tax=Robiginitalea sp. IMCC44478 TaxID=3459122 RepID=UPI0040421E92
MKSRLVLILILLLPTAWLFGQVPGMRQEFTLKGRVVSETGEVPLSGIEVSTDQGVFTLTDGMGEFRVKAAAGDVLIVRGPDIQTVRYRIKDNEDIKVVVSGLDTVTATTREEVSLTRSEQHRILLDSANWFKRKDLSKSLNFISRSIEILDGRSSRRELALSLTTLGEIYQFHGQLDLAISNYEEGLETFDNPRTLLLLGKAYVLHKDNDKAIDLLSPRVDQAGLIPYQKLELYETLGDAYRNRIQANTAVSYYQQALTIASKNQIAPKIPDLNSKIADAYQRANRSTEAETYYGNSLKQAKAQNPRRAVQEFEKVADFYNQQSRYPEEIALRKQSLEQLKSLNEGAPESESDSISTQGVNYKIASAYIAQDQNDLAIPFLSESIKEADNQGDLVVQKDATRKLSEVYRDKGDFKKALDLYQQYVTLVDTLYIRKEQELSQASRFSREISESQSRINSLEQERELSRSKYELALTEQRLTEEINKRQQWIIYSLIFGLLLTGLAAFFYYRSNRQQQLANYLLALKGLRTQMNPHFIFNALNSVNNYIAKNDERAANRYLSDFSVLMRRVLENSEKDLIPLSEEIELLELYLKLEHTRFPDKFDYSIDVAPALDVEAFEIPPMLLQPFLENAVWHGLRYKDDKGILKVQIRPLLANAISIEVTDNGIGRKQSARLKTKNQRQQKSRGMGNIAKRISILNQMYGDRISVEVSDLNADGSGTRVLLKIRKK